MSGGVETDGESLAEGAIAESQTVRLTLGRHVLLVERTKIGGTVRFVSDGGATPFEIEVTEAGPVLRFGGALSIAVGGALTIDAATVSLHARDELTLASDGALSLRAGGNLQS